MRYQNQNIQEDNEFDLSFAPTEKAINIDDQNDNNRNSKDSAETITYNQ